MTDAEKIRNLQRRVAGLEFTTANMIAAFEQLQYALTYRANITCTKCGMTLYEGMSCGRLDCLNGFGPEDKNG